MRNRASDIELAKPLDGLIYERVDHIAFITLNRPGTRQRPHARNATDHARDLVRGSR